MDFAKALTYPFDDEDWLKKIGLGVLIQFIPVVGTIALQGWSYEIMKRVKNNDPSPLPAWEFGAMLSRGFQLFIAGIAYSLPTFIFLCIGYIPTIAGAAAEDETLAGIGTGLIVCCACIAIIYGIVAGLVYWAGLIRYMDNEELGTFFQIGDNIALFRANGGDFGMALVYIIGASFLGSLASSITAGIGTLLLQPFMSYFSGHIIGQLAAKIGGGGDVAPAV